MKRNKNMFDYFPIKRKICMGKDSKIDISGIKRRNKNRIDYFPKNQKTCLESSEKVKIENSSTADVKNTNFHNQNNYFSKKFKKNNITDEGGFSYFGAGPSFRSCSSKSSGDSRRFSGKRGSRSVCNLSSADHSFTAHGSNDFSTGRKKGKHPKFELTAPTLAKRLSELDRFEETLLQLFDKYQFHYELTKQIALRNLNTFEVAGEVIRLRPKVKLCSAHSSHEGCKTPETCDSIHFCPEYVAGNCKDIDCLFGHTWRIDHNLKILTKYNLNFISIGRLSALFKTVVLSSLTDAGLKVRKNRNDGTSNSCPYLNLCMKFLAQRCSKNPCPLDHCLNDNPQSILKAHGISLNESHEDIFNDMSNISAIKENIDTFILKDQFDENEEECFPISDDLESQNEEKRSHQEKMTSSRTDYDIDLAGSVSDYDFDDLCSDYEEEPEQEEKPSLKTMWSHDLIGDVMIPEICHESVEGLCQYEESGCFKLHSTFHYYWQVKALLGKKDVWVNLTEEQVHALEKAYCDPNVSKINVPVLNPLEIRVSEKDLLLILKGRSKWEADFETMKLNLLGKTETLKLRRLCTEITANKTPDPCIFKWYFVDKNQKWIEYGNFDSTGNEKLKCNVNSNYIESEYFKNPLATIHFTNQAFSYVLDLGAMTQTNQQTNVVRTVRRRPRFKEKKGETDLPPEWEPMKPEERCRRVTLQPLSDEYKKIDNLVQTRANGKTYTILKIERVQNPYIFRAFQNKVKEMKVTYRNDATVDIRQLFHGTWPDIVPKICDENFDWRLHGTSTGQTYGRGTYFAMQSSYSYEYAQQDANGHRYMFVAKVAVGTITQGNAKYTRPPINVQYNLPYDSTVDDIFNPSIIVKYDKQEYYPEYIVTY